MATRATGQQIREAVAYWQRALGLEGWNYTIQIGRLPGGDYGSAEVDIPYKRVHFRFWPKGMQEMGESIDSMAVHEWCHVLTDPLATYAANIRTAQVANVEALEEHLTTELERLVLRLHKRPNT